MTNVSNGSTEYPAERLGNTNPIAAAVKEVVGPSDAPLGAAAGNLPDPAEVVPDAGASGRGEEEPSIDAEPRRALAERAQALRERMSVATDGVVAYTRDEPVKALLCAAVAGALLMALLGTSTRSRR